MSCADRRNKIMRDLKRVKILAQRTADLLNANQIIYKTICDGVQIYKFSQTWKGKSVCTVRPSRKDTSKDILSNTEYGQHRVAKPRKKRSKKRKVKKDLGQPTGRILLKE
jgi:hypothetical protein